MNPSPQVSISAVPGTTICSGQSVALSGIYTPQPQITDVSFANLNLVNIPNGCNGPAGCQLATSSVTSTGILPANLIGGQITSICFTLRHEDYTEFTILNFQMGANTYTSVNPAPAGEIYNADIEALLVQIQAVIQTGGNNSSETATFCLPQSFLTLLESTGGPSNTTWSISIQEETNGPDNGSILDFEVIIQDYQNYLFDWTSTDMGSITSGSLNGTTTGGNLDITATPTAQTTYTLTVTDESGCPGVASITIDVVSSIVPDFASLGPYCQNDVPDNLLTTSLNSITGSWNPSSINTSILGSTDYVFTPDVGQCAIDTTITVQVTTQITPTFNSVGPYCQNDVPDILQLTSNNGISGTWIPSIINTSSSGNNNYIFTPSAGQCATTENLLVTVNQIPNLIITDPSSECSPNMVDLTDLSVTVGSDAGTLTYWTDASATNSLSSPSSVSSSNTYYIQLENSGCTSIEPVVVVVNLTDDASFTLTSTCFGGSAVVNGTAGGTFSFNTAPGDAAIIDAATGTITNGTLGTTYDVLYVTSGICPASLTQSVTASTDLTYSSSLSNENCGVGDGSMILVATGGDGGTLSIFYYGKRSL